MRGDVLTKRMCDSFRTQCRIALKGSCQGHESVELQQFFRLGHASDLLYFGLQVALHKLRCARVSPDLPQGSSVLSCISTRFESIWWVLCVSRGVSMWSLALGYWYSF